LKLEYDEPLSNFALKFNLRRYDVGFVERWRSLMILPAIFGIIAAIIMFIYFCFFGGQHALVDVRTVRPCTHIVPFSAQCETLFVGEEPEEITFRAS